MTDQKTVSRQARTTQGDDAQARLYREIGIPAVAAAAALAKARRAPETATRRETPYILRVEALD